MNVPVNVALNLKHMFCFLDYCYIFKKFLLGITLHFGITGEFEQRWRTSALRALENNGHIALNSNSRSGLCLFKD